ncbi:hypothetical protein BsWGS_01364 [Bradybaena similaris]
MADQMSNIERSRIARSYQGNYETEVSFGDREDLPTIKEECQKNPGHPTFIPYEHLSLEHFPPGFQNPDVLEFARMQALLTVCLVVNYTSSSRPATLPGSEDQYPFYNMRGTRGARFGTGSVLITHDNTPESTNRRCYCKDCVASGHPRAEWGKVIIQTVKHVVFNDEECQHSDIEFFYDNENHDQVYKLSGHVVQDDIDSDWCMIYCPTHDMEFVRKLQGIQRRFDDLKTELFERYKSRTPNLAVIASHPHGLHKQITIGTWTDREVLGPDRTRYVYSTDTCPGSSGAKVWILAEHEECPRTCHMHSQAVAVHRNMSGIGWY